MGASPSPLIPGQPVPESPPPQVSSAAEAAPAVPERGEPTNPGRDPTDNQASLSDRIGDIIRDAGAEGDEEFHKEGPPHNPALDMPDDEPPAADAADAAGAGKGTEAAKEPPAADAAASADDEDPDPDDLVLPWEEEDSKPSAEASEDGTDPNDQPRLTEEEEQARSEFLAEVAKGSDADPDQVVALFNKHPRGRRIYESFKMIRDLGKPVEQGGLGFQPTSDQIKQAVQDSYAFHDLHSDMLSGDPDRATQALNFYFGPNGEGKPKSGAEIAVRNLPRMLWQDEATRPLFRDMEKIFLKNYSENLYAYAEHETDPGRKQIAAQKAAYFDWALRGKYRSVPGVKIEGAEEPSATSEKSGGGIPDEVRQLLDQQEQQLREYQTRDEEQYVNTIQQEVQNTLSEGVDAAIGYAKDRIGARTYRGLRDQFVADIELRLERNPQFMREITELAATAAKSRSTPDLQKVVQRYRQGAGDAIRQLLPEYRRELGSKPTSRKEESDQRHAKLAAAQTRREPSGSGGGAPVKPSAAPRLEREVGESQEDYIGRKIDAIFVAEGVQV